MLYAIRLGPMEDDRGAMKFWYIGFADMPAFRSVLAKRDEDGLRRLVAILGKGQELQCEPALAKAGKKLGFVSQPMPELVKQARGFIAYGRGLGSYGGVVFERDDLPLGEMLAATQKFMKAKPWRWWSDAQKLEVSADLGPLHRPFEGSLAGFDGQDCGISLYPKTGALDRMAAAIDARDVQATLAEDGMALTVTAGPEWAAEPMEDAYGFRGLPVPVKLQNKKLAEIDPFSLHILIGALEAASLLRPDNLTASAEQARGDLSLVVTIHAPAPLA
jgi:hypothetical protein